MTNPRGKPYTDPEEVIGMLVLEGNAFYEIDEECLKKKEMEKEEKEKNTKETQEKSPG